MKLRFLFFSLVALFINASAVGQVTLLSQNFGTTTTLPTGWTSSNATNGWAGSTASVSSGYTGASGSANVVFNGTGTNGIMHTLTYSNSFSTVGYTNITVLWGARSTNTFTAPVTFEWSTDGTTWNTQSFTNVAANSTWALVNGGTRISLPAGAANAANLRFRWTSTTTNNGNHRIDDFSVQGTAGKVSNGTGGGDWNTASTWNPVGVPTATDDVVILAGDVVSTTTSLTRTASTTVNGAFQLNTGGFATGTNFTYGAAGTLNFFTTGNYVVNGTDVFWPAAAGSRPYNVSVLQADMTLNASRIVDGTFTLQSGNVTGVTIAGGSTLTINGTCRINNGGFFGTANSPVYGAASTLLYNTGGVYGRGFEWNALGAGTIGVTNGYPNNVQLSTSGTSLNYINGGTPGNKAMAGNLTIDAGTNFYMDYGFASAGGFLTVAGNVNVAGNISLGFAPGDDLKIGGNLAFTGIGAIAGTNNRAIFFIKNGTQTISSVAALTIPYIVFQPTSGSTTVQLLSNLTVSAAAAGNAISFSSASDVFDINGNTLTIGNIGVANTIFGSGTFKGSTTSNLTIRGLGSIGTIGFTAGFQNLGTFTTNREASLVSCVLSTPVTVNTSLALTFGLIDLGNNTMTLASGATTTGATTASYVIADVANGTGASLRKTFSAAPSAGFTFPIGDRTASANGSEYSPVTITSSTGTWAGGYVGFAVNDIKHPNLDANTDYITRYWAMTNTVTPTTYVVAANYLATDVVGAEANCRSNQWNGTAWTNNGGTGPSANTLSITCNTVPTTNHITKGYRNPDINIRHVPSSTNYLTGSTYDFGTVAIGFTNAVTFTIQNLGQQNLTLTATTSAAPYIYTTAYASSVTGPSGTTTFVITFTPTATGTFTGSITIPSNDPDEASYVINFTGVGVNPSPEINLKGFTGGTNPILSGQPVGAVSSLNNTLFTSVNIGSSQAKDFEIQNVAGSTAALNLTGAPKVAVSGTNASDFVVTSAQPSSPIAIGSGSTFVITFTPSGVGTRTALITIANNDNDENPYTYYVQGTGVCTAATNTVTPTTGPVGTEVTITAASNNLTGATATFNGVSAVVTPVDATHIKVIIPAGATTGDLITTNSAGCTATVAYTVINSVAQPCEGGFVPNDLFISQFTDSNFGSLSYVEIYNGTGTTRNLSGYSLQTASNGGGYSFTLALGNVNLASGSSYVVALGNDGLCGTPGGDGSYAALTNGGGSVNFTANQHDHVALFNGAAQIDSWGVFGSNNWAPAFIGTNGASFSRLNTVAAPNTTYSNADWTITDYAGTTCSNNDYSDIGNYVPSPGMPPTVTLNPAYTPSCKATSFTVSGTEGFAGGNALAYQWYAVAPNTAAWTQLSNTGVYSGVTTATLSISNLSGLDGYQFYCQIRENGVTCYSATNAVKVTEANTVTWNGSAWSPSAPTIGSIAVINGAYNTSTNGDIDACSLIVNSPATLTVSPSDYVNIQNDLTVNTGASLVVQNSGSLVMIDDNGVVTNNGTTQVVRTTSPYNKYDYTYWSSPVTGTTIGATFPTWRTDYAFQFVTANYADVVAPFDGFDDNQNAWVYTPPATVMSKGKGYAIMAPTTGTFPTTNTVTFSGPANNGVVNILLAASANGASNTDDFNLIGNPYPSAIDADDFINQNTNISGTLYFWTHRTGISNSNPGPDANNFITADYAMYNLSGGTSSGTGSPIPNGYVSTGEGFFVEANAYTNIVFNNSMRSKTHDNSQFFRHANPADGTHLSENATEKDRLWLNLESADGLFSQQLIAYFNNTTLDFDRGYDGIVSQSSNTLSFYSFIGADKYRIQARPAFDIADVVPLGFSSSMAGTYTIGIGTKEGQLNADDTHIYLEDKQLGIIHDLKQAPYSFTTSAGVFNERFVLRYMNSALGNDDFDHLQNNVAVAVSDNRIAVKSYSEPIGDITVYDILGRQVFEKQNVGENHFMIDGVVANQQALIVKVRLENGSVINKKIIY